MELIGDFISLNGHKRDKVFTNKNVLIHKDTVALVAESDDGILVLTLSDKSVIQCDGTLSEFSETVNSSNTTFLVSVIVGAFVSFMALKLFLG